METLSESPKRAPYGIWDSPISAKMLASTDISILQIAPNQPKTSNAPTHDKIYYTEARPAEQGRHCIVECTFLPNTSAQLRDVLPQEYSARTRVHGYGGGAFACQYKSMLVFADEKTNGVYSLDPENRVVDCIVPGDKKVFYADFNARDDIHQRWILAVCEDHHSENVINSIVAIDVTKKTTHTIVSGADFYTCPQLNTVAGHQPTICWTQWYHPDMPWTGSQLFLASWNSGDPNGSEGPHVDRPRCIAGKPGNESVAQPKWNYNDGSLLFCSDISGYWQIYRLGLNQDLPKLVKLEGLENGNFAGPEWWLGRLVFPVQRGNLEY
jgi:hypothetical protein